MVKWKYSLYRSLYNKINYFPTLGSGYSDAYYMIHKEVILEGLCMERRNIQSIEKDDYGGGGWYDSKKEGE